MHGVEVGEVLLLETLELVVGELESPGPSLEQDEAVALELHQAGNTTSARRPPFERRASVPRSSSRTRA